MGHLPTPPPAMPSEEQMQNWLYIESAFATNLSIFYYRSCVFSLLSRRVFQSPGPKQTTSEGGPARERPDGDTSIVDAVAANAYQHSASIRKWRHRILILFEVGDSREHEGEKGRRNVSGCERAHQRMRMIRFLPRQRSSFSFGLLYCNVLWFESYLDPSFLSKYCS